MKSMLSSCPCKPSFLKPGVSYGSNRRMVSCRASLNSSTTTTVKPAVSTIPAQSFIIRERRDCWNLAAGDLVTEVYIQEEFVGMLKRRGWQDDALQVIGEKSAAKLREALQESDKVVCVFWVPIDRQSRFRVMVDKKQLLSCTQVAQLRDCLATELGVDTADKSVKMWWSDLSSPDIDNPEAVRNLVVLDRHVPYAVNKARAWVLQEKTQLTGVHS